MNRHRHLTDQSWISYQQCLFKFISIAIFFIQRKCIILYTLCVTQTYVALFWQYRKKVVYTICLHSKVYKIEIFNIFFIHSTIIFMYLLCRLTHLAKKNVLVSIGTNSLIVSQQTELRDLLQLFKLSNPLIFSFNASGSQTGVWGYLWVLEMSQLVNQLYSKGS